MIAAAGRVGVLLLDAWKLQLETQEGLQNGKHHRAMTLSLCPKPRTTIPGLLCHQGMISAAGAMSRATLRTSSGQPLCLSWNHRGALCKIYTYGITLDTSDAYQDRIPHLYDAVVREAVSSQKAAVPLLAHVKSLVSCTVIVTIAVRGGRRNTAAGRRGKLGLRG